MCKRPCALLSDSWPFVDLRISRRYTRAFAQYELNMGERHPLDGGRNRTIQERATTSVPGATEMYTPDGYAWAGTIKIGTPAKSFRMNFDTVKCAYILHNDLTLTLYSGLE